MFRLTARSKSAASLLSAAFLASALLTSAAVAAPLSAGNSFEIPLVPHDSTARAYYGGAPQLWGGNADEIPLVGQGGMKVPAHATMTTRTRPAAPAPMGVTSNPAAVCVNGERWTETAANGWTLPMPCHS